MNNNKQKLPSILAGYYT